MLLRFVFQGRTRNPENFLRFPQRERESYRNPVQKNMDCLVPMKCQFLGSWDGCCLGPEISRPLALGPIPQYSWQCGISSARVCFYWPCSEKTAFKHSLGLWAEFLPNGDAVEPPYDSRQWIDIYSNRNTLLNRAVCSLRTMAGLFQFSLRAGTQPYRTAGCNSKHSTGFWMFVSLGFAQLEAVLFRIVLWS